jgi:hypothetical protein
MNCPKIALTLLILGSMMVGAADARAQTAPTAPVPPAQPAAAQASPQADGDSVGSVATLQGGASVTHNNAAAALKVSDPIFKNDVLQTNADGTLSISFDDETTFTLKPSSRIAVDNYVYQQGGTNNAAVFKVLSGTVAFVAAEVAHTGNMQINTPTSTLGIRGTTGLVEVPANGAAGGAVSIKLYPDADGRVGRIEVFGRDGAQLGILTRGASGFAVRPGPGGRFTAAPLQISREEEERDRTFVRQTFTARQVGRQINVQRRSLQQQQRNQQQRNQSPRNQQQPGLQRPGQQPGLQQRPELRTVPGGQPLPRPGLQQQPGTRPQLQQPQPGTRPGLQPQQPGMRPMLQRPMRPLGGARRPPPPPKKKGR